jgi:hypothetical protein
MNSTHPEEDVTVQKDDASGVILLKAGGSFGDPVELTADAARELATRLNHLADELE